VIVEGPGLISAPGHASTPSTQTRRSHQRAVWDVVPGDQVAAVVVAAAAATGTYAEGDAQGWWEGGMADDFSQQSAARGPICIRVHLLLDLHPTLKSIQQPQRNPTPMHAQCTASRVLIDGYDPDAAAMGFLGGAAGVSNGGASNGGLANGGGSFGREGGGAGPLIVHAATSTTYPISFVESQW